MKNKFMVDNPIMNKDKISSNMNTKIIEMRNIINRKIHNTDQKIVA